MPEKSIREMSDFERRYFSLESRIFRSTFFVSFLMVMIAILLVFFTVSQGITFRLLVESEQYSKGAASLIEKSTNPEKYAESVMRSWRAIPEDIRKHPESAEFKAYYEDITKQEEYRRILDILKAFYNTANVDDIYFGIYDKETSSLIFVADPGYDNPRDAVGQYEVVNDNEVTAALDSDSESISYVDYTKKNGLLITGGFKVRDDDGHVVGHILVDISLGNIIRQTVRYVIRFGILMTLIGFLLAYFMSRHMRKMISNPINTIAQTAEQYTVDKMAGVEHSHYFSDITIRNGDEIENLWLVMKEMEEDLNQYEERLTKVTTEKERINTELALATKIQADTLPNVFPPFPDHQEFNIFATMKPAKEVGGDFYDFFLVDDDHLALVIADVSGKGIPAALFMMISKILIKNHTMTIEDPAKVLEVVNNQICANNREEMFVTVWLGILDLVTGTLTASNAGHEYPLFKKPDGDFGIVKDKHDFVIGGMKNMKYRNYTIQMDPGSKLVVYTDGVPEAENEKKEFFGLERTLEAVNHVKDQRVNDVVNSITDTIKTFVGSADQFDDMTMLCIEYLGRSAIKPKNSTGSDHMILNENNSITISSKIENIRKVTQFVNQHLNMIQCPEPIKRQMDIAIDEVLSNIVFYAYEGDEGQATVTVEIPKERDRVSILFEDNGIPYDPLQKPDPDVSLNVVQRAIGGLGIFLVKKMMDDVQYEYKDETNRLKITKMIDKISNKGED